MELQVEQLFAAVLLARRDGFGVLLGSGGRLTVLKMASCLLGALLGIFVGSTKIMRLPICLAHIEWL